jgi:hypothetical protein
MFIILQSNTISFLMGICLSSELKLYINLKTKFKIKSNNVEVDSMIFVSL